MPDLDAELAELRDLVRESVPEPELHQVLTRSRQRATRRRTQIGAVIAVVVVAAAIPVMRTALRPVPDGTPAASATDVATPAPTPGSFPIEPFVYDIDLVDATHGFAMRTECNQSGPCRNTLLATEDGEHWDTRSLPEPQQETQGPGGRLFVLGPKELVIGDWYPMPRTLRFHSADGGRTWQEAPEAVESAIESVPPGAVLEHECTKPAESTPECRTGRLLVSLPGDGRRVTLANQPPLERMWPGTIPAADGNWWVPGVYPGTDKWAVAVSRNAGRSWSVAGLPDIKTRPPQQILVSAGSDAVYVTALGELPDVPVGLLAIFRSTNGGASWEQTWQAADGREPRGILGGVIPAPNGGLRLISIVGKPYVSQDGGRTFVEDTGAAKTNEWQNWPLGWVRWTRAGYLAHSMESADNRYRLSADGQTWREFTVPLK